jgi:hypothetical protein
MREDAPVAQAQDEPGNGHGEVHQAEGEVEGHAAELVRRHIAI